MPFCWDTIKKTTRSEKCIVRNIVAELKYKNTIDEKKGVYSMHTIVPHTVNLFADPLTFFSLFRQVVPLCPRRAQSGLIRIICS